MTAEVAVLNKFGIALAADSAVTVEHYHHDAIHQKIYNSANKLFTLSKFAPVGVMIYNSVTLGGIPYETLIKEFRRHLGKTKHPQLRQYADEFFGWLANNKLFSAVHVADIVNTNMYRPFRQLVFDTQNRPVKTKAAFVANLNKQIGDLKALPFVPGFDDASAKALATKYAREIEEAAKVYVKTSYRTGHKKDILEFAGLLLTKKRLLTGYSGIVIAGFGEDEAMPQLREYYVDLVVDGRVRFWLNKEYTIDHLYTSHVVPLADAGAIGTLTEGISQDFEGVVLAGMMAVFRALPSSIINQITQLSTADKQTYVQSATQALNAQLQAYWDRMQDHKRKNYTSPMKSAISALPLSELSVVAETFVSIAQIQKRVAAEQETVGGPVDIAVISKGDGFIWTKRKFYFDDKLNPAFKLKYMEP